MTKKEQQDFLRKQGYYKIVEMWNNNAKNNSLLGGAFVWCTTPEGADFWESINRYVTIKVELPASFNKYKGKVRWA